MVGLPQATSAEVDPEGSELVVAPMACSVFGQEGDVHLVKGTSARKAYGRDRVKESYRCHYSLNPAYRDAVLRGGLVASGYDDADEVRVVERTDHPFFVATLYLPQHLAEKPHPLLVAFLRAALGLRATRSI